MENPLFWGLALLGVAILLVIVEVFLPSGGAIAILAGATTVAGVVLLFIADPWWGLIGLLVVAVFGPLVITMALNIWKNTPVGRKVMGAPTEDELRERHEAEVRAREELAALVGVEGVAVTGLRPIGVVKIEGKRYDASAELGFIESGQRVRVVEASAMQIKVRPA
ncbi:MAG: hypothetical protein IT439_12380 [Phycisphaerales bacterium]|nr:hypothetical protein [Phycisphaerales bacterium]